MKSTNINTNGRVSHSDEAAMVEDPLLAIAAYKLLHSEYAYTKLYWGVANTIGIPQALLIEIIEKWCQSNERCNKRGYLHNGEWWTSATYKEWADKYPALGSDRSIQRLLLGLEESGYVLSCQAKKGKGDKSKFYRVDVAKVGALLLNDKSIVPKMDDVANNAFTPIVPKMDDVVQSHFQPPIVPKVDDVNDTSRPIVPNSDDIVPKVDDIVPKVDHAPPQKSATERIPGSLIDQVNILTQSITTVAGQSEEVNSHEQEEEKAVLDIYSAVNNYEDCATNDKTPYEDPLCGAAKNNLQKRLTFNSDLTKEFDFLGYYRSQQKSQGKDIRNVASYLATTLSKGDEGSSEVHCLYKEWQAVCGSLGRKISDFAEDPEQIKRQRERYDFANWEAVKHQAYFERLKSEGLAKFRTHEVSSRWYEWAIAKHPERFANIPA
jgi:hypothetical protein